MRQLRVNITDELALMDDTADIMLGGNFSMTLGGPVPANLVVPIAAAIAPLPGGASNPANFLI